MRVDLITLGCSKNLVDSEFLIRQLESCGFTVKHDDENPTGKIVIVNTCGFIGDAKEESIDMILQFAERKRLKKVDKLFVMGCLSERYLKELGEEIPEVDKFYGKFNYNELISDLGKEYRTDLRLERTLTTGHYAYVKIAEGCNRTCSYCAIPIITGRYKSRSIADIESEVRILVSEGVSEFQLIAQDLSYYGLDGGKKMQLPELLSRLSDIKGVEWLRLHYAYPTQFPYEVLSVMRERDNVCKYLDIALQHISDKMLRLMRRHISSQETYDLLALIRQQVPGIHLRTTLMVGHPGETEEDFTELMEFVKKARFERMGAFAYSHEEGTFAYKNYEDEIPFEEKQRRLDQLMALQQEISSEINARKVGHTMKVIIDREVDDYYIGRTEFDSPEVDGEVLIDKQTKLDVGSFYQTKITQAGEFDLFGSVLK